VIASAVISKTGPWGLYHFTAACGGVLGGAAWICRKKLAVKVEDQVAFFPMPKTSPMVGVLDPRSNLKGCSQDDKTCE
jgi:hypothetical protein